MKKFQPIRSFARFFAALFSLVVVLGGSGCAHSVHLVHAGDFASRGTNSATYISAATEQFVILGIKGDTDYVNQAYNDLKAKCDGGVISGITTQFSTSLGFFSWTNKILMQGSCIRKS